MRKYNSQSLAIVLAILIVGSIIGFALYARLSRESVRVVDEKAASESHELVETVIGLLSTAGYENVKAGALSQLGCDENILDTDGCRYPEISLSDLQDLFEEMGLSPVEFDEFAKDLGDDYCLTELGIKSLYAEGITIEQDDVYSVFLSDVDWDTCNEVIFAMDGMVDAEGFVMSAFSVERYSDLTEKYKPYSFDDIFGFKYGPGSGGNWKYYDNASDLELLTFSKEKGNVERELDGETYALDEVRFKSLGGTSTLTLDTNGFCQIKDHLLVEVGATCGGKNVGKSFILPEEYFAPPMFDYVYFQGQGDLN